MSVSALVLVESYFGNTASIGRAIAGALPEACCQRFDETPPAIAEDIDLLVLGAPTHEFKLPTPKSRRAAATRHAADRRVEPPPQRGLAEWIVEAVIPPGTRVVTFDTSTGRMGTFLGCAAKDAASRLRARGVRAQRGPSFTVTAKDALAPGQRERAAAWAATLP